MLDFAGGKEWCLLKLGVFGTPKKIEVDTNHFKGNFPDSITIEGTCMGSGKTILVLPPTKLGPHKIHLFDAAKEANGNTLSHVKVTIQPDGGISRLRVLGHASN